MKKHHPPHPRSNAVRRVTNTFIQMKTFRMEMKAWMIPTSLQMDKFLC